MSPEATWSLIGAVLLLVGFLAVALMRISAYSDRMNDRWIERYRLTEERAGGRAADGLPRRPQRLYDQDEEA